MDSRGDVCGRAKAIILCPDHESGADNSAGVLSTSNPLIKSAVIRFPAGYGSYDLLTFVTGCSR
jgi:hypothetical protein